MMGGRRARRVAPIALGISVIFNNANWFWAKAILLIVNAFAAIPGGHVYIELPKFRRAPIAEELCDDWFWLERRPCWNWGYGG